VQSDVLLHLIEPAAWRTALAEGAVRPPSLDSLGFVHLSTPDQVHVPAQALFPGRRDLALLVVDPARLTDPVRLEPGDPPDPDGLLFPHLYGPLPTSAVIAVVPYRPPTPPVLPAPDDVLARALALYLSLPVRRAVEVQDVPGGVAVSDPRFPASHAHNRLLLSEPLDVDAVERISAAVAADAGWPDQAVTLSWPGAEPVAAALATRDWDVEELLIMARPSRPVTGGDLAEVVDQSEVHDLWGRSWRADAVASPERLDDVVAQLVGREHLNDAVVRVSDVVVRENGRVVAAAQLYVDGGTAAIESVLTDGAARGRGYGDAVLARSLNLADDAGCDLVVLEAAADDWPRHWYRRRGFATVGTLWVAVRTGSQTGTSTDSNT
jgi:uncharacterized protein (DUF952 family)/ribosomal protein S18 acetylase RimI-like enzyme